MRSVRRLNILFGSSTESTPSDINDYVFPAGHPNTDSCRRKIVGCPQLEVKYTLPMKIILQQNPPHDQEAWNFNVPQNALYTARPGFGKCIKFTAEAITLDINQLGNNRILQEDDASKFISVSFGDLRFPDSFLRVTGEYIGRLMKAGLFLNGVQYRFYHHSNSQLVSYTCKTVTVQRFTESISEVAVALCDKQTQMQNSTQGSTNLENFRKS